MGPEMELYTDTRLEEDVRCAWVHKKTRKKTNPLELATLL